jgi:hypothetical protein
MEIKKVLISSFVFVAFSTSLFSEETEPGSAPQFSISAKIQNFPSIHYFELAVHPVLKDRTKSSDEAWAAKEDGLEFEMVGKNPKIVSEIGLGMTNEAAEEWIRKLPETALTLQKYEVFEDSLRKNLVPVENGGPGMNLKQAVAEGLRKISWEASELQPRVSDRPRTVAEALLKREGETPKDVQKVVENLKTSDEQGISSYGYATTWHGGLAEYYTYEKPVGYLFGDKHRPVWIQSGVFIGRPPLSCSPFAWPFCPAPSPAD